MTVIQCPFVKFHVHDDNGFPASGWRLYTFKAGTDEPLTAYKDAAGTVEYGAYALLNARGEPDGDGFFLAEGMAYKLVLKRPDGSTAWSEPYVLPSATGGSTPGGVVIAARSVLGNASASPADAVAVPVVNVVADEPNAIPSAKAVFEAVQTLGSDVVRNHGEQTIDGSLAVSGAVSAGSLSVGGENIDDRYIRKAGHAGLSIVGRSEGGVGAVSDVPMVEALTSESDRSGIPNAGAVMDALDNADTGMTRVTANDSKGFLAGKIVGDGVSADVAPNAEGTKLVVSVNQDLVNRIGAHEGEVMVDEADSLGYLGEKFEFGEGLSGGVTEGKKIRIQNSAPDTLQTKAHAASSIPGFLSALAVAGTGINIALSADMEKLVFTATGSAVGGFYWKGTWDSAGTYNANNAVWYFDHTGDLPISRLYIATTQNQGINPLADAGIGTGTCWSCMMAVDYMGDQFVMLDTADTQAGFLADKLKAGNYVTLTRNADAGGAWYTIDTVAPYQVSIGGVVKDYNQLYGVLEFVGAGGCSASWNGRSVQITGLGLGTTSSTAARGDQGKTAYDHSQAAHAPANADNTQATLNAGASKTTPVDADTLALLDSAASNAIKKLSWANVKSTLKTYFDGIYSTLTLGTTSTTAARGDQGKTAYDHSQLTASNPHGTTASQIASTATGDVSATNVQAAIAELASEKLAATTAATTYAPINTTLADNAARSTLPETTSESLVSKIQQVRDYLKYLLAQISGKIDKVAVGGVWNYGRVGERRWRGIAAIDTVREYNGGVFHIVTSSRGVHADIHIRCEGGWSTIDVSDFTVAWSGVLAPAFRLVTSGYKAYLYLQEGGWWQTSIMRMEVCNNSECTINYFNYDSTTAPADGLSPYYFQRSKLRFVDGLTSDAQAQIDGKQPVDAGLTALAAKTSTGLMVQTGEDAYSARSLAAGTGTTVTNGAGVAGDPAVNVTYGTTANTACQGNDGRLSDARTPTSHASTAATYGRADSSNYGHAMASSAAPAMNGETSAGTDNGKYAREGHVHPTDTSKFGYAGEFTASPVIWKGTHTQYNALGSWDSNTIYMCYV